MRINNVLECFNKVLESKRPKENKHVVAYSNWKQKMGPFKEATTVISIIDPTVMKSDKLVVVNTVDRVYAGEEELFIEKNEEKALIEFIKLWDNDSRFK